MNDGPLYRLPYGTVHPYAITAPLIGIARGAYDSYVGYTRERAEGINFSNVKDVKKKG